MKIKPGIRTTALLLLSIQFAFAQAEQTEPQPTGNLLKLLQIIPSERSVEFVQHQTQFQLHSLPTEQRHPKTSNLSRRIAADIEAGLKMLLSVDEDISKKLRELAADRKQLDQAVLAVSNAILTGKKIIIFGNGTSGRLAQQIESTYWRPFWKRVKKNRRIWKKLQSALKIPVEEQLFGVQAGGDRALISRLEGFEDLPLLGKLQLRELGYKQGDIVFGLSCDGASSSVIGAMLEALEAWKKAAAYRPTQTRQKLFFVTNNPHKDLSLFPRFRRVLNEPGITRIDLSTGPQAVAGSTRMQAATITHFIMGNILQAALDRSLRKLLSNKDMTRIGFKKEIDLSENLLFYSDILRQVRKSIPSLAKLTALEAEVYRTGHFTTYFAGDGFLTAFVDSTERSRAFKLPPLDTIQDKARRSWSQVWSPAADAGEAWLLLLGRPFRGLSADLYYTPIKENILDRKQEDAALASLALSVDQQHKLYDLSFAAPNLILHGPKPGDLGILIALSPEEELLKKKQSPWQRFIRLHSDQKIPPAFIFITGRSDKNIVKILRKILPDRKNRSIRLTVSLPDNNNPLGIDRQIALKLILNTHSTAVMALLGRIIGNTMTHISPDNLKLIGRATHLILSHVNSVLRHPQWVKDNGINTPITYGEANAILLAAADHIKIPGTTTEPTAEVAVSIIRILESLRLKKGISWEDASTIIKEQGLGAYLTDVTS